MGRAFRADIAVSKTVIVEIWAVPGIQPAHEDQRCAGLPMTAMRTGPRLNFHVARLKDGLGRFAD